ncbi:MAG: thiol peroxidase [Deltaproteobacteria bacterium HGW-Deltaproteobacteria-4]|nr:MAG: thiol peroxidase [Deltaproteobacteria bacterium HGW-Deltaproteobacteria-4]
MEERSNIVTFKGNPATLLGPDIKIGDPAPEFRVVDNALQAVTLASNLGRVQLITVVPSIDTPVCDTMTRKFNEKAAQLPESVVILTVSVDLPFAQKRWCGNAGVDKIKTVSDYQDRSFGLNYGLLLKELKLLARAVYVIDKDGKVAYREIVKEVTAEPDYDAALAAAIKLA